MVRILAFHAIKINFFVLYVFGSRLFLLLNGVVAYSDSRLVTRPDSDWLKTDSINTTDSDDTDD